MGDEIKPLLYGCPPASPSFNVVFGLRAWVLWTKEKIPERRGSYIDFCSTLKFECGVLLGRCL